MILRIIKNGLLLAVPAALSCSLAYGQAIGVPVVPPGSVGPDESRPHSWVVVPADGTSTLNLVDAPGQTACNSSNPCYYTEGQIWTAYGLPPLQARGSYGEGITIGIVDAYYDSQTLANLQAFSADFGLPVPNGTGTSSITCSTNPTLTIVNQTGGSPTSVSNNASWDLETNLDVQQAHSMAPCANILLVAANNNSNANLYAGVKYAYAHADIVTDSWGGNESASELTADSNWSPSHVPILFSAGDTGAETEYPCTSPYVTCIGGTTLLTTPTSFRTLEYVWNDGSANGATGGGCSSAEGEPSYQTGFTNTDCGAFRGVPDTAALADEFTGVNIYLSTNAGYPANLYCCVGGTSLASPLTAGIMANVDAARVAAGKAKLGSGLNSLIYAGASYSPTGVSSLPVPYGGSYRSYFYDVYSGNSGFPATLYWDKATGLGVPYFSSLGNYLISIAP
jgi:subtilase family serine protease